MTTTPMLRVLSLGAGVQSSTLYLMAVQGEFGDQRPDAAIFADTQWEPRSVYEHLDRLEQMGGSVIPIRRVTAGSLRDAILATKVNAASGLTSRVVSVPFFTTNPDGSGGMLHRQCTRDYKLRPIQREVHKMLAERGQTWRTAQVEQWIGISTDEATRMKESRTKFIHNRWPLIERNLNRRACTAWLSKIGVEAPKSACLGCPYSSGDRWAALRERPDEWADTVAMDERIRNLAEVRGPTFMHASRKPLPLAPIGPSEDELNLFENECEGMCGV